MEMKNPPHPGVFLSEELIEPFGLNVTETARILQVGRQAVSAVLNGRAAISPEMAIRFEKAFGVNAGLLLRMQAQHALAQSRRNARMIRVRRFTGAAA